jgi:hypothetical protein
MTQQLQAHLAATTKSVSPLGAFVAKTVFRWLPPAGILPLASGTGLAGFDVATFFTGKAWNQHLEWPAPIYMEGGRVEALVREAVKFPPIDLDDKEMLWLYSVRQNIRALDEGNRVQPYAVFANANIPFLGEPRFDRSHANYSNFV